MMIFKPLNLKIGLIRRTSQPPSLGLMMNGIELISYTILGLLEISMKKSECCGQVQCNADCGACIHIKTV